MKTKTFTKAVKQNWKPLQKINAIKISVENIQGSKIIVTKTDSKRIVID